MSRKHNQRTRAEILARRSKPSELPAPRAIRIDPMAVANKWIADQAFTAATRRAMRSKYTPHEGAKQQARYA